MVQIWTDGSSKGLNAVGCGKGGWAYLIKYADGKTENNSGAVNNTTNQRMELLAAFNALLHIEDNEKVHLYTDSAYLYNCWKEEWWKKWEQNGWQNSKHDPVANRDLWEKLIPYFKKSTVKFLKVKGHAGQIENELVDKLATTAADTL